MQSKAIRVLTAAAVGALLIVTGAAAPAIAASPAVAQLISPASGSTASSADVALSVRPSDPDGGNLQVRFEGRKRGATVPAPGSGDPFTLVALPDTQNYTYNNRQGTMTQQAQWVVNTRSQLNTAMVVQLGDLVSEEENLTQWGYTSTALKVMDDAGVPNTVVAGNHDFNNITGDFSQYDQFFPPSRYLNAQWIPTTTRYGGYLGQNLFGADPVDTRNMNNFALFSAGGRDWLVLNLEWDAPSYATNWAAKVLAAYPDRTAIMVTHAFVGVNGTRRTTAERPGGTPADKLWTDFVSQQCQIKLVLNGHFHNGDAGEANRSDLNRCGEPVQQILTDYQSRANGGDGWLRYYTFDPAANTMTARTYSPKLGTFETDADSQFTLPFSLAGGTAPAPFQLIGTTTVASGSVATRTWTGLDPDTWYEWRAVTSDGQDSSTSPTWEVRTPQSSDVVDDTFSRIVTNGWGATAAGQPWQYTTGATAFSVNGSVGRIVAPVGSTRGVRLPTVSVADQTIRTELTLAPSASGSGTYVSVLGRINGSDSYRAKIRYLAGGSVNLSLIRYTGSEVSLASSSISGLTVASGQYLSLRFELDGSSPTTLRAKLWPRDVSEPTAWTVTASDSTASLQQAGSLGIDVYPSSSAASPATAAFDRYTVTRPGVLPPTNQSPTAVIGTPTIDERKITVSGAGSNDPDGSITEYAWDFGDGATDTGADATHTYAADGSYVVKLTVTDNSGAKDSATREVTVAATPPTDPEIAADSFSRTVENGWGAAQVGGSWTILGSGSRYGVSGGTGNHILTTAGTTAETVLSTVNAGDVDLRASLAWSRTGTQGSLYGTAVVRRLSNGSDYRLKVISGSSGSFQLVLARKVGSTETTLRSVVLSGVTQAADVQYRVAFRAVTVAGTTTLSAKLWKVGATEPTSWAATVTDSTAQLQGTGSIGFSSYLSSGAGAAVTMRVNDLIVVDPA
ncbi:MAG: PKD domain-containing protein [Micropruina sp.]